MLLSLVWVACKDTKSDPSNDSAQALETAMQNSKAELTKTITDLQTTINTKITEAENELATAADDAKVAINTRLDGLRKQRTDLENLAKKVNVATAEGWADFQQQAIQVIAEIKEGINK